MGQAEQAPRAPHQLGERARLGGIVRHRLFADHVDAALKKSAGDGIVQTRRRGDDHGVDPVRPCGFLLRHFAIIGVDAVGGHKFTARRRFGDFGIDRHGAGRQFAEAVGAHRDQMRPPDDRISSPADHAEADPSSECFQERAVDHCSVLLKWSPRDGVDIENSR